MKRIPNFIIHVVDDSKHPQVKLKYKNMEREIDFEFGDRISIDLEFEIVSYIPADFAYKLTCSFSKIETLAFQYGDDEEKMVDIIKNGEVVIKEKYGYFYLEEDEEEEI